MNKTHLSYKFVIGSQYFVYFGVMGIFLPYFNLYCFHLGFSGFQIGVLSALKSIAMILFPLIWGFLADRFQIRRPIYIICNLVSTSIWICYLYTVDFWPMLIITAFYGIFYAPIIAFIEAFTMDILGKEKKSYGRLRVWGSVSFILTVILFGRIIDIYSIDIILVLILLGSLLQTAISFKVPDIRSENRPPLISGTKAILQKPVIVFLGCGFLMLVSHGTYYGFFSIHIENLGYGKTFIGITWALAVMAEILVMVASDRIFRRFSLENVLIFSFGGAVLRWLVLFFVSSPVVILLSQLLHALSYGTFHMASILYIDQLTPDETKTVGQAVNNGISYGLGLMVGFLINGYLYEKIGSFALFGISGLIALAGGLLLVGFQRAQRELRKDEVISLQQET